MIKRQRKKPVIVMMLTTIVRTREVELIEAKINQLNPKIIINNINKGKFHLMSFFISLNLYAHWQQNFTAANNY